MSYTAKKICYFDAPGSDNTNDSAKIAVERAQELGINTIVVASTTGRTALECLKFAEGTEIRIVAVTHAYGFREPDEVEFPEENAVTLIKAGGEVVTGTHVLSGLERSFSSSPKVGGGSRSEAVSETLRRVVATGLKVAVECVLIACDQGIIDVKDEVVAVGGTATTAEL